MKSSVKHFCLHILSKKRQGVAAERTQVPKREREREREREKKKKLKDVSEQKRKKPISRKPNYTKKGRKNHKLHNTPTKQSLFVD